MKARSIQIVRTTGLAIAIAFCMTTIAAACPTCKDSLAGDPAQQQAVQGYFYSILFMMATPFVLLGSFGGYAYFTIRRAQRAQQAASSEQETRELQEVS